MKKLLGILVLGLMVTNPSWSGSPCIGWEEKTNNLVVGDCSDEIFFGYVNKTGDDVFGACIGGMLSAWNSRTDYYVFGDCSYAYNESYKKYGLKKFK